MLLEFFNVTRPRSKRPLYLKKVTTADDGQEKSRGLTRARSLLRDGPTHLLRRSFSFLEN